MGYDLIDNSWYTIVLRFDVIDLFDMECYEVLNGNYDIVGYLYDTSIGFDDIPIDDVYYYMEGNLEYNPHFYSDNF